MLLVQLNLNIVQNMVFNLCALSVSRVHPAEAFSIDSLTLHTIKLIQYARKVRSMIQTVHQQLETLVRHIMVFFL